MLLKPISPTKYDGEVDNTAFLRFVCERSADIKMGWVPLEDQVFYLSYYLKGKASDFYNQIVISEEETYTMKKFFIELFDFIFPPDFHNMQWNKLNRCNQNEKSVTAHVAEFIQIYNTIGLNNDQEKVIKI
jgi:hypothetical protein